LKRDDNIHLYSSDYESFGYVSMLGGSLKFLKTHFVLVLQNKSQEITSSCHLNNLKELMVFMKEPIVLCPVLWLFFFLMIRVNMPKPVIGKKI
jgi:hypothetical protein